MQILNTGYIICNGINNCPAIAFEHIKNLTGDVQYAINNCVQANVSNTFSGVFITIQNQLYAPQKCDTNNFTASKANISKLQVNDLYVTGMIMNGINNVCVGVGQEHIYYSKVCNRYAISTVVNANSLGQSFVFDIIPTAYNSGQIIHFFNGNLNPNIQFIINGAGAYWPISQQQVPTQQFLIGTKKYTSFYLTAFKSCTLIYVENNTWMGIYSGGDPPSDNSQTSVTINYLEYTYPTLPTFPDIVY